MEPYFIFVLDDNLFIRSLPQPQIIQEHQEIPNNLPVASGSAEVMENTRSSINQGLEAFELNVGTDEATPDLKLATEKTLDNKQTSLASSMEEPTKFSIEQLLKLAPKQRRAPRMCMPTTLENAEDYEKRMKNAQASRLWRERKRKLDGERVKLIQSRLQEVEQLKKELERYQPLEEKYSQLQRNYTKLQEIVAKLLAAKQE